MRFSVYKTTWGNVYGIGSRIGYVDWSCWAVGFHHHFGETIFALGPLTLASSTQMLPLRPMYHQPAERLTVARHRQRVLSLTIRGDSFLFGFITDTFRAGIMPNTVATRRTYFCFGPALFVMLRLSRNTGDPILFPVRFWARKILSNFR